MRHHDDHDCDTTGGDTMTKKTTNGHHVNGNAVRWMQAHELPDLPAHLAGGLVASQEPDETPIWGDGMPDPDALAAAVDRARRTVALQDVDELMRAKSPTDIAKDLEAERELRDLDRERKRKQRQAEIAEAEAIDAHEQRMRDLDRRAREASAHATVTADALTNPHHEVVRLHRARRWVPALAAVPGVFALVAGAINVGSQLDRLFPGVPFVSWVIDPIITLAIIAIGAAHLYDVVRPRNTGHTARAVNPFRKVEVFLFALTSTAAVALHYPDGPGPERAGADGIAPLIWLSIPVGLGVSLWLVPKLRAAFTDRLTEAREEARRYDAERALSARSEEGADEAGKTSSDEVLPTPSDLHGKNSGRTRSEEGADEAGKTSSRASRKSGREEVTATIPAPQKRTREDHRKKLVALVEAGEIDPDTVTVNATKTALRCQWGTARDLLVSEYGRADLIKD